MSGATGQIDHAYYNPCTAAEALRYAAILRQLLNALDGEIVAASLIGERQADLLHPERQEMDRVREFLHGRIAMRSEPTDLRSRGLALLDAFLDEGKSATEADHHSLLALHGRQPVMEPAFSAFRRWLQRKAWVRRLGLALAPRPSDTTTGEQASA